MVAVRILAQVRAWIRLYHIQLLDIGLEQPVYNANVTTYGKQSTLIQAIEAGICGDIAPLLKDCWVYEPIPSESKKAATGSGSATKAEIWAQCPMNNELFERAINNKDSCETIADAWAHSLTTEKAGTSCFNAKIVVWPTVEREAA